MRRTVVLHTWSDASNRSIVASNRLTCALPPSKATYEASTGGWLAVMPTSTRSLLSIEVVERLRPENDRLGEFNAPLIAVRIEACLTDWIVGYAHHDEIARTFTANLVGFTRLEEKRVTRPYYRHSRFVTNGSRTGEYVVELPLCAMRVVRARRDSRRNALDLDIKRMTLEQIHRVAFASEGFRKQLPIAAHRPLRRPIFVLTDLAEIDFLHIARNPAMRVLGSGAAADVKHVLHDETV